jgi:hypothetical protein
VREHREDLRVDLVGLARQGRQALDLVRIGEQHLPAQLLERVVHEPRPALRLDHRPHRLAVPTHPPDQAAQPIRIRPRRRLRRQLSVIW